MLYLDHFAPSWRRFHQQQMALTRVLVVDDDERVGRFLNRALKKQGFTVDTATSVAKAWPLIESRPYDLIIVDKTMPGESGLVLLEKLRDSDVDIPAVLITGDPSLETVDQAMRLGAEDYISKPFGSIEHLVQRLRAVLDRRITSLLFDVMLGDLSKAVHSGTGTSREFTDLSQTILECKLALGRRPACTVVDSDQERGNERRTGLYEAALICTQTTLEDCQATFAAEDAPLVAAVSLETPDAVALIRTLRERHPKLEIFALAGASDVDTALAAVEAGAADFALLGDEGMHTCARRIERLVRRARRHQLYLDLVGLLYQAAREVQPDLAKDIIFATPERERPMVVAQAES